MPDPSETLEQAQAPSSLPLKTLALFSPDTILHLVKCRIPRDGSGGFERSRPTMTAHILRKVNQVFDEIQQSYSNVSLLYSQLIRSDAPKEQRDKALRACLSAREMMVEAWMAITYFNYMLKDLDRSRAAMDMMTIAIPPYAAPLGETPGENSQRRTHRTYYSRIPAILRQLPETLPTRQHATYGMEETVELLREMTLITSEEEGSEEQEVLQMIMDT